MNKYYFLGIVLIFFGCSPSNDKSPDTSQREKDLAAFDQLFSPLSLDYVTKLDCADMAFGSDTSDVLIPNTLIQSVIDSQLLKKALFNDSDQYYSLGKFPFSDQSQAYLIGAYGDPVNYSTHLFLKDNQTGFFTHTQSLNYKVEAGSFRSKRDAWLKDMNGDNVFDIVYFMEESREGSQHGEDYVIFDSIRVEAWDGEQFSGYFIDDPESIRSEYAGGTNDDFF